jgi:hypothetical protein
MLVCSNDGKGKEQSYEVFDNDFDEIPHGYGQSFKEALSAFTKNTMSHASNYQYRIFKLLLDLTQQIASARAVDYAGKPVEPEAWY